MLLDQEHDKEINGIGQVLEPEKQGAQGQITVGITSIESSEALLESEETPKPHTAWKQVKPLNRSCALLAICNNAQHMVLLCLGLRHVFPFHLQVSALLMTISQTSEQLNTATKLAALYHCISAKNTRE